MYPVEYEPVLPARRKPSAVRILWRLFGSSFVDVHPAENVTANVHAREGLACRKRVSPASSPAAPAIRVRRSRRLRSTLAAAPGLLAHALIYI
jgi:hypothetical protein